MVGVAFTATDTSTRVGVMPQEVSSVGYNKDFTAGGYQYTTGFQLEEGSTPTSYIPTEGSQVTRASDLFTMPMPQLNKDEGTFILEVDVAGLRSLTGGFATAVMSIGGPGRTDTIVLAS